MDSAAGIAFLILGLGTVFLILLWASGRKNRK